jgi:hypothetical protein
MVRILIAIAAMSLSACSPSEEEVIIDEDSEELFVQSPVDQDDVTLGIPKDVQQKAVSEDTGVDQELP